MFYPMASEMKDIVISSNTNFRIERLEGMDIPTSYKTREDIQYSCSLIRAAVECVCQHFGPEVVDELFRRYPEKFENLMKALRFNQVEKWECLLCCSSAMALHRLLLILVGTSHGISNAMLIIRKITPSSDDLTIELLFFFFFFF